MQLKLYNNTYIKNMGRNTHQRCIEFLGMTEAFGGDKGIRCYYNGWNKGRPNCIKTVGAIAAPQKLLLGEGNMIHKLIRVVNYYFNNVYSS